ncbi:glycoside hydrolase family 13 protein [Shewanella sp.]|uniref:glycoside hydrolase family 13 protein n=1 Tax=Shewanella sp. TaxID=50422 RepID=UPI0035665AB4
MPYPLLSARMISVSSLISLCLSANAMAIDTSVTKATLTKNAAVEVSPPDWWTDMQNPTLELMLHGENLSGSKVSIKTDTGGDAGINILSIKNADSPNYLFVTLDLSHAKAGGYVLKVVKNNATLTVPYELKHRSHGMAHQGYSNQDVIYLITPDRFANGDTGNDNVQGYAERTRPDFDGGRHGGDLAGIARRLDYLNDLGITQLWINPLLENAQPEYSYHGYSITNHYQIDPRFGSNHDYQMLSEEAGQRGMGIIMDVVLNHIGSGHPWMQDLPFQDWVNPQTKHTSHRRTAVQDPYAAPKDAAEFADGWFVDSMPDLNQRNPHLARYLIQNTLWWIETARLSGLRIDTWSYSDKAFLKAFSHAMLTEYPRLNMVGEEWSSNPVVVSYWQAGKQNPDGYDSELPGLMDFPLYETLLQAVNEDESWGTGLIRLYEALANDKLYPKAQNLVLFEGNHDTNRLYSLLGHDMNKFKLALAYVLLSNRVPQIFYGTEFAMQSPVEGRNDGAVRADMPGFTQPAFGPKEINAMAAEAKEAFAFTRALLHYRKTSDAIHHGRLIHFVPENGLYVQLRLAPENQGQKAQTKGKSLMAIFNKNNDSTKLNMQRFAEFLPIGHPVADILEQQHFSLPATLDVSAPVTLLEF